MKTITEAELVALCDALDIDSLDPSAVRRDYSGRGMYGDSCLGFVVDWPDTVVGVALAQALDEDTAWEMARAARGDNMGMRAIVYFPGYTVEP